MDLQAFDTVTAANEGRWLTLKTPDGTETDVRLRLAGADSDLYRAAERAAADRRFALGREAAQSITKADLDAEYLDRVARCTLDWEGLTDGGKPLEFTAANVRRLYESAPVVLEQAGAFLHERSRFLTPSKPD